MRTVVGPEWQELRNRIIDIRGRVCENCGRYVPKGVPLILHHLDRDASHNEESNLILVCEPCHDRKHNRTPRLFIT
jgi:5-methylcytosine-specific restriction endonuclease McrA